jgi:tetratricopeptide (TPR) repeat protein
MQLANRYWENRNDSAITYYQDAIDLAQKISDRKTELRARYWMAEFLLDVKSDYVAALNLHLQNIKIEEQLNDTSNILYDMRGVVFVFEAVGDYNRALEYVRKMRENVYSGIYKEGPELTEKKHLVDYRLGVVFEEMNSPDSAKHYFQETYSFGINTNELVWIALGGAALAEVLNTDHKIDSARYIYRIAARASVLNDRPDIYAGILFGLANSYLNTNELDSAFYYSMKAYISSKDNRVNEGVVASGKLISEIYHKRGRPDSAYIYLAASVHLKDSLLSDEKLYKLQSLGFEETLRQKEVAAEKKAAQEKHVRNLQLLAIGVFIPVFFIGVLLLSRTKVKPRVVEFLGILSLLLFFEFITDLIYPWVSQLTNENPIWEMSCLVILAALLEPLNFRLEHWVKGHLVHKPVPVPIPLPVEDSSYDVE